MDILERISASNKFLDDLDLNIDDSGFVHLANVRGLRDIDSFSLPDGMEIRPPNEKECLALRHLIEEMCPQAALFIPRNPYETEFDVVEETSTSRRRTVKPLERSQWKYVLLSFTGTNTAAQRLVDVSSLAGIRLRFGPMIFSSRMFKGAGRGLMGPGPGFDQLLRNEIQDNDDHFLLLSNDKLHDLADVYKRSEGLNDKDSVLVRAIRHLAQLDPIPRTSPLRFLGHIAILESIITHAPKKGDPYDSLTRQVSNKMVLIGNRSPLSIPYGIFRNPEMPPQTIWKKIYAYRSRIAHGGRPDFKKEFSVLRDPETTLMFIEAALASLMRELFEEPELVLNLHDC